jgi:chromosome segregation ATPase
MFSFDTAALSTFQAEYGILELCIINMIVSLFLMIKLIAEKKKNREFIKLTKFPEQYIQKFLRSQFNRTKNYNLIVEHIDHKLNKEVVQLRTAYLKIEEKALEKIINTEPYWKHLDENLLKLIKIIFPQTNARNNELFELESKISLLKQRINNLSNSSNNPKVEKNKARAIASLEQMHEQHKKGGYNRTDLQRQLGKMESLIHIFENPDIRKNHLIQRSQRQYLNNSGKHIDELARISSTSAKNIDHFENTLLQSSIHSDAHLSKELQLFKTENESLSQQIQKLKSELEMFKNRIPLKDSLLSINQTSDKKSHPYEMADITQELIESNEKEIDRLRDVIAKQRHSIFEMEESLNSLEEINRSENSGHQAEIDKLKRCIRESEICISMLEKELDELRDNIADLKDSGPSSDMSVNASEQLNEEVKQLKTAIEQSNNQLAVFEHLNQYASDALSSGSIEDIALLVYESIVSLNYLPSLLIKASDRTLELSTQGAIPIRDKASIDNMQINEVNLGQKGEISFRFLQISGKVHPPLGVTQNNDDKQLIVKILQLTDKILILASMAHKGKQQAKIRDDIINSIKHTSYDLDKVIEDHNKTTKKIVSGSFQKISDMARVRGMTATQVAAINGIGQETMRQIEAANTLRLKSRKDFLSLINVIERST